LHLLNTFKIDGVSRYFAEIKSREDLSEIAEFIDSKDSDFFILGGGSNVLISDKGFDGIILKISLDGITWNDLGERVEVVAEAGVSWDSLVGETVKKNLYGLENLSGIPGTVGAAPIQNIGAYGSEVKNTLEWVEIFDLSKKQFKVLDLKNCKLSYRDSVFKKPEAKRWIVTKVAFLLNKKGQLNLSYKDLKNRFGSEISPDLDEVRKAVLEIRSRKFPDLKEYGTAGSFFKNPIISKEKLGELLKEFPEMTHFSAGEDLFKISTAWILDNVLGLKGKSFGQVELFRNQPLVVVNLGRATATEIKKVTDEIIFQVKEKLGITLEREVTLLGEF